MQVELSDDQVANLRWLMQALGGDPSTLPISILTVLDSGWAEKLFATLPETKSLPAMTLDEARKLLGRFAADSKTQQEVDDLRAVLADANSVVTQVSAALDAIGIAPQPQDVTGALAQKFAAIRAATLATK